MPEPYEFEGLGRTFDDELSELAVEIWGSEEAFRAAQKKRKEALDPMGQAILQRLDEGKKLAVIFDPMNTLEGAPYVRLNRRGYKLIAR